MSIEKHTASDVSEAIALAERFKKEGKYDWFRGQSKSEWKVRSTCLRKKLEGPWDYIKYRSRIKNIFEWFNNSELTKDYLQSDAIWAIMQHHGFPTDFIDFTTEPQIAGFFANDTKYINQEEKAAIICLNTKDLEEHFKIRESIFEEIQIPIPEKIIIDVSNLWRLEAQYGVFLFCRFEIEDFGLLDYRFDRIEFPISPLPDQLKSLIVYPKRKSIVEEQLDKFLTQERWKNNIASAVPYITTGKFKVIDYDETYEDSPFKLQKNRHESWLNKNIKEWLISKDEKWDDVSSKPEIRLEIKKNLPLQGLFSTLIHQLKSVIINNQDIRGRLINFTCEIEDETKKNISVLDHQIQRLWDGIRIFPYTDNQLIRSITNLIVTIISSEYQFGNEVDITTNCYYVEEPLLCALGDKRSYDSRGVASRRLLLQAIRPDIEKYDSLFEFYKNDDIKNLLIRCPFPYALFDFNLFTDLFISEVVPSQCVFRSSDYSVFFSPAELVRFGIP